jgi:outer membrane receptor protein involved in Fe transport
MTSRGFFENKPFLQILLLALVLGFSGSAWAQDDAAEEEETADLDRIAVTGSRIKRAELEGPSAVLTIDRQDMEERGYSTVYEALQDLTINNGFMFEGPESTNGFSPDVQTLNIRNFGVGTTLTLINGRRLTNYPVAYQSNSTVFSYGSIPVAAIERVEILTTGASAIYGSDAVAGVINIILRSDIDETTVNVLWGTPTETSKTLNDWRIQLVNGKTFNRGSYTFTMEYMNRDAILGKYYDDWDDQREDYPYGAGVYDRSLLTLDWFRSAFGVFPRYRDPAKILGTDGATACSQSGGDLKYTYRRGAGMFCGDPDAGAPAVNFRNERESLSLYFNGSLEVGNNGTELFTDILYFKSESQSNQDWIPMSEDILDVTKPDTVGFGFFDWYLAQRFFNSQELGGLDLAQHYEDDAYTAVAGARGIFADLHDWELSVAYSSYDYESRQPWFKWRETIDTFLGSWMGVGFFGDDWWSGGSLGEDIGFGIGDPETLYGPANSAVANAIGTQRYKNNSTDLFINLTLNGDLWEMRAGPVSYAAVLEYEEIEIDYIPDELITQRPPTTDSEGNPIERPLTGSGWYRLTGFAGKGTRERWAIGGEMRIPLHETFTLNLAARYDDYDSTSTSFGGDVTPSISMEWRPLDNLLFRAGYTQSFRAPDMAAVFTKSGSFTSAFDYISCYEQYVFANGSDEGFSTADCDSSSFFRQRVGSQEIGLEPLDAETGDNYWIGFAWDIMDNLSLTVDYTDITLEQRVISQSTQGLLNDEWACFNGDQPQTVSCDQVSTQIVRGVDPLTGLSFIDEFFITSVNQFKDRGKYIDVKVLYNLNTEAGLFRFDLLYTNMIYRKTWFDEEDTEPFDLRNDPRNNGNGSFRSSFVGTFTWAYSDFSTTLTAIYRGSSTVLNCTSATNGCTGNLTGEDYLETGNYRVDPYTTWNWTGQYNWTDQFLTRLRVVNVFDEKPPWDDTMNFFEQPWYNTFMYAGAGVGRYAAIELEYTF